MVLISAGAIEHVSRLHWSEHHELLRSTRGIEFL